MRKSNYIENAKVFLKTIVKLNNKELSNELFEKRNIAIKIRSEALKKIKLIKAITVYHDKKQIIYKASDFKSGVNLPINKEEGFRIVKSDNTECLEYFSKIGISSQTFGYIGIFYSLKEINHAQLISYLSYILFLLFGFLFLVIFQQYYLRKIFIAPLIKLQNAMQLISSENKIGTTINIKSNYEVESLANSFNQMSLNLKKLYEEISQSKERFHIIFNQTFQLIALLDKEGNLIEVNRTGLNFIGEEKNKFVGNPFWETPWWSYLEEKKNRIKEAISKVKAGKFVRFETFYSAQKGKIYIDFSLKPVFDKSGNVIQMIAEGRDITERKIAESQLSQAQKMEMVGTLAGGLAHDFNNLLAGILGSVSLIKMKRKMKKEFSPVDFDEYISIIEKSGDRATNLVQQLLSISRKQELVFTEMDLNYSIKNIIKITKGSLDKSVSFDFEFGEPAIVKADPTQIEQVLLNLCVNAAHSMTIMKPKNKKWGGKVVIKIDKYHPDKNFIFQHSEFIEGDYIKISIKDEGVGIEEKNLEQIFNPFFTTKEKGKGTGLGLSMVYNIIKQHSGYIYVTSQKNVGSEFQIYLPAIKKESQKEENKNMEDFQLVKGEGLILIVDDEEILRITAQSILEEIGYSTIFAVNGQDAINIYEKRKDEISLILLDMVMPIMSGKETFIELKKINPYCKIILSSGFKKDERVQAIIKMGVDAFLQKPYGFKELVGLVQTVLKV
jgi:PAS domain S-box-containing protein